MKKNIITQLVTYDDYFYMLTRFFPLFIFHVNNIWTSFYLFSEFNDFWKEFCEDFSAAGILLWAIFLNRKDLAEICWRSFAKTRLCKKWENDISMMTWFFLSLSINWNVNQLFWHLFVVCPYEYPNVYLEWNLLCLALRKFTWAFLITCCVLSTRLCVCLSSFVRPSVCKFEFVYVVLNSMLSTSGWKWSKSYEGWALSLI